MNIFPPGTNDHIEVKFSSIKILKTARSNKKDFLGKGGGGGGGNLKLCGIFR